MLPYIYTEARRTYDSGLAFVHPLYYEWPESEEAYSNRNQYMFGEEMFVDPVVAPGDKVTGLVGQSVWVPPGEWIEADTGKHLQGPTTVKRNFSIRQAPVYVRAGAIVPMAPPMLYSNQKPLDPLIVNVYPLADKQTSHYVLYEDAGNTRDYQQDQAAWTGLTATETSGDLTVTMDAVKGSYPGMPSARQYEVRLPGDWPPQSVAVNGQTLSYTTDAGSPGWHFEGNTLTTVIRIPARPVTERQTVLVRRSSELASRRAELDGFAGAMTRLREAYDTLNQTWPIGWSPDDLIDAMQTGDRLSYHPELAATQIPQLYATLPKVLASIDDLEKNFSEQERQALAERLKQEFQGKGEEKLGVDYHDKLARAKAAVSDITVSRSTH
jgi:alpha-glucosidase